jgi:hypothetical protein
MTATRVFTVEEAHVNGWCHDSSVCTHCLESRAKVIAQLEAEGNFELLWKHYR